MKWTHRAAERRQHSLEKNTCNLMEKRKRTAKLRLFPRRLLSHVVLKWKDSESKEELPMLLLIILLVLLFGGGGGYYGHQRWGMGGGLGIGGTVLLIVVLLYLFGGLRL
jgi:hypothetical protein